ncbi:glycosyltransferase family 4 protein [Rossellomorea vietnamensis]|uniref:Glycosyltransferase family 4 protein n=1 Tax=Rossellomorea vietnamensis TaxID=218284 RepID=A0A5D4MAH8_9BACI|nr:glycosyltransferase family 4 protein [Rossellomorea vietnamensis]TYR98939.1 glycosyltransferase family 4 protein [Rossellomorea vietnamensis]
MKIHLIANMYPSEDAPSYGVFVQNTEKILQSADITVDRTVLTKKKSKFQKLFGYAAYSLKIILKGLVNNYDYTYVHYAAHNSIPLLVLKALKKNVKIVTNVHGSDVVPEVPSQEKFQKYVKALLGKSYKIITPSNYYKGLVKEKYGVSTPIEVFPSGGVNKNLFFVKDTKEELFSQYKLDKQYQYAGFVSRMDVGKGWDVLLDAIADLKKDQSLDKVKFVIVGDGKQRPDFEAKVSDLGLEDDIVRFSLLPQKSLADIYNCLEIFCFPTTRKGESLGLVGLEAMACGAPVVGSAIGGLLDYVEDGQNGFLFQPGDSQGLADGIKAFFHLSSEEKEAMKRNALAKADEYEVENIKPLLINVFK